MRRHISVHRATTKPFSNSGVFKAKIEKESPPTDRTGKGCEAGMPSSVVESARSRCYLELATEGKETVYVTPACVLPV